jgi:hypothetical protein
MWKHSLVISAVPGLFCCYLFFASTQCSRCRLYAIITLWLIADLHQQPLLTGDRAGTRRRSGGVVGLVHSAKHEVYTIIIDLQQCLSYATHSRNLLRSHEPDMSPPGPFPTAHSMPSYWRSNSNPIDSHRSSETLPSEADIVIVGAGYSGAAIAHHLIEGSERQGRPLPSIVILEAREACSGATGRNGMSETLYTYFCWLWSVLTLLTRWPSQARSLLKGSEHPQDPWQSGR